MSIETRARGQTFRVTGPVTKATRLAYSGRELHIDPAPPISTSRCSPSTLDRRR
jgi:hypothetical protein